VRQLAAAFHRELARGHSVSEATPASKLACNKAAASCRTPKLRHTQMQNQVANSASPQWTRWLEQMSSWLAPLKPGYPLRGRSDFSIDWLDSAPRQELSLREIADFSVRCG